MRKVVIVVIIVLGFIITFSSLFLWRYPNLEESIGILERTLEKEKEVPRKNVYYTIDHKKGTIRAWNKPKEK